MLETPGPGRSGDEEAASASEGSLYRRPTRSSSRDIRAESRPDAGLALRLLSLALLGMLVVMWVMLVDLWPTLPARIPLLPPGIDATDPFVERSLAWWFGPPAGATLVALLFGLLGPRILARRAADGRWNPVPHAGSVRQLPPAARLRIVQPIRLGLVGATICPLILVVRWWVHVAETAEKGPTGTGGAGVALTMLVAASTFFGAGWTFSRSRAAEELAQGSAHHE